MLIKEVPDYFNHMLEMKTEAEKMAYIVRCLETISAGLTQSKRELVLAAARDGRLEEYDRQYEYER